MRNARKNPARQRTFARGNGFGKMCAVAQDQSRPVRAAPDLEGDETEDLPWRGHDADKRPVLFGVVGDQVFQKFGPLCQASADVISFTLVEDHGDVAQGPFPLLERVGAVLTVEDRGFAQTKFASGEACRDR